MELTKEFYTTREVATLLGVALRTVYRWIETGQIKAIKLTQWRITKADLEEFLRDKSC